MFCGWIGASPCHRAFIRSILREILPPRGGRGSRVFNDENLDMLSHVLDDWLRIPGTSIRFGLDAIVGLVPGIGDVLGGLASCILIVAAWFRGVPYVTLMRMVGQRWHRGAGRFGSFAGRCI